MPRTLFSMSSLWTCTHLSRVEEIKMIACFILVSVAITRQPGASLGVEKDGNQDSKAGTQNLS